MTIHFTLNYPVEGVVAGGQWITWEGKYAVLIPVTDFMERIVCLNPVDTWIIGELKLPSSAEILIYEDEYNLNPDDWRALAGNAKVIPVPQSEKIHEAIKKRISQRGYQVTYGHDHAWYEGNRLEYIENFIRHSELLSFEEKQRLISLAVKKGYQNWNQIFLAIAEKYKKRSVPHRVTFWREIETISEEIFGMIFEPRYGEEEAPAKNMRHKLEALAAEVGERAWQIEIMLAEEKFLHQDEIKSLKALISELEKIREWVIQLIKKSKDLSITWKEFLQQEKII